jgi:sugar lactone lactonase YvrE
MTRHSNDSSPGSVVNSDRTARRRATVLILLAFTLGLSGCGEPKGVLFEPLDPPLRWPPPPAPARLEYVGQLVTEDDLKPGRSFGELLNDRLFGREDVRSMLSPYALCSDGAGRLFVCDSNAQVVHVFDLESRRYERWPAADDETTLGQPLGLAWDRRGRLLVADGAAGHIVVLDRDGGFLTTIGAGVLQRPCGIVFDELTGRIIVADVAAHEVVVLDSAGTVVRRVGGRGVEPGLFNFPTNLAIDSAGNLYVSDSLNFRVQVFDRNFAPVRQVGSQGDMPGFFSQPKGVAVDSEDHLYVVDAHFESVQIFDDRGRLLLVFGREGQGPGEFWLPAGIHIDSSDRIWVADSYNRRVQVFQYLGETPMGETP